MNKKELERIIKDSAKTHSVLRIKYKDKKDQDSIRNIEPYEIKGDKLWAYCRKKKGIRQFDLNKVSGAIVTKYTYFPKWPVKLNEESLEKSASHQYQIGNSLFGLYYEAEDE